MALQYYVVARIDDRRGHAYGRSGEYRKDDVRLPRGFRSVRICSNSARRRCCMAISDSTSTNAAPIEASYSRLIELFPAQRNHTTETRPLSDPWKPV